MGKRLEKLSGVYHLVPDGKNKHAQCHRHVFWSQKRFLLWDRRKGFPCPCNPVVFGFKTHTNVFHQKFK